MVFGLVGYGVYRRRFLRIPLRSIEKAPPAFGPALALEYRRLVVPVIEGQPSDEAMDVACRLAAERGSRIVALYVLEIPLDRPLPRNCPARGAGEPRARRGGRDRRFIRHPGRGSAGARALGGEGHHRRGRCT
jgi:hypothetical protein